MATKRMTAKDYKRELRDLQHQQNALKSRIIVRAKELIKENPDVMIHLSCFINSYKASHLEFTKDTDIDSALKIIQAIENDIASKHPHKQTNIEFPTEAIHVIPGGPVSQSVMLSEGKAYSRKPLCPKISTCKVTPHNCTCDMKDKYRC
jgi:hypothetical protein